MCDLVVARLNAAVKVDGALRRVRKGAVLCACDPLVVGREHLFQPHKLEHYCGQVEQATSAPGEKRRVKPASEQSPKRPPTNGPGSGVEAWRDYAHAVTGEPLVELAKLTRDELIELVPNGDR